MITGASSGIGRQCAISCSQMGANVVLIARNEQRLKETYQKLAPGNHLFFCQDITEYKKLKDIVNEAVAKVGQLAGFVHSAGIEITLPARSMNSKKYEQLFATNVISGFEIAKIISNKKFINHQRASFVFIASITGIYWCKRPCRLFLFKGSFNCRREVSIVRISCKKYYRKLYFTGPYYDRSYEKILF